jgi:hypothetical protein
LGLPLPRFIGIAESGWANQGDFMTGSAWTALAAFLVLLPATASAQQKPIPSPFSDMMKGTPEEERACAPDSAKFCQRFEPDPLAVLGCLQRNRTQISKSCQTVLRNRGV